MYEALLQDIGSKLFIGGAVFSIFAVGLFFVWIAVTRALEALVVQARLAVIGTVLKEINTPVMLLILLLAAYFGVAFADEMLLAHPAFKIWAILAVLTSVNIMGRTLICLASDYCKRSARGKVFVRVFLLIKEGINVLLYAMAVILIVEILSPQLGLVVAMFGVLLMTFVFFLFSEQMKNVIAGMQVAERYVKPGDYVQFGEIEGYVDEIRGRTTAIKSPDGASLIVPNFALTSGPIKNYASPGGGNFRIIKVLCKEADFKKALDMITSSADSLPKQDGVMKDYTPIVTFGGVRDGLLEFGIKYNAAPFADFRKIEEELRKNVIKRAKKAGIRLVGC